MSFTRAIQQTEDSLRSRAVLVHPDKWQSVDVSKMPEMATHELLHHSLRAPVHTEDLQVLRDEIQPNLPWADDHFLERVSEEPLNPGVQWEQWPYAHSANKFRTETMPNGQQGFSHTYMERMWPKLANRKGPGGVFGDESFNKGIRYKYGDALDVVDHLSKIPLSRQAYLPIWFPEDTGKTDVRVPCTLGYHFILRHGFFHCTYYIRSCDFLRHMRDDIYLTVRLQLWMLDRLRTTKEWQGVKPGLFIMHITSLHVFRNDWIKLGWA